MLYFKSKHDNQNKILLQCGKKLKMHILTIYLKAQDSLSLSLGSFNSAS